MSLSKITKYKICDCSFIYCCNVSQPGLLSFPENLVVFIQVMAECQQWPLLLTLFNTLRRRQNRHRFADYIFKCIFLNENAWILIKISMNFVPKGLIKNIPALVQIMAWHRPDDKPLSEPMMVSLLSHIYVTWPQWVNFNPSMDK